MYEETGLSISNLEFCGIKDWIEFDQSRYMVFLYKTNSFVDCIKSSSEGEIFWMPIDELKKENLYGILIKCWIYFVKTDFQSFISIEIVKK